MRDHLKIGFALTGSFCTFEKVFPQMEALTQAGIEIVPIMSERVFSMDTRFGSAEKWRIKMEEITKNPILTTLQDVEPIGPKKMIDALVIAPCTGSTLSKLASGMADTSVSMAAKSTLRNERPVILAVSTNDGLGAAAKNIGLLHAMKNFYFVPYGQDDPEHKPNSLVAHFDKLLPTVTAAMAGRQLQPVLE